jgi:hypothetical protein
MDMDKLNRWMTLGANLGVLAGLLLLVLELSQSHDMMRAQTRHEIALGIMDLLLIPAADEQLADLMYRAETGADLTPQERYRFNMRTNALFRYWEDVHYQYRIGLYDEVEFERQREAWKASLNRSVGAHRYWCEVRTLYSPDYMAEMDALLPAEGC